MHLTSCVGWWHDRALCTLVEEGAVSACESAAKPLPGGCVKWRLTQLEVFRTEPEAHAQHVAAGRCMAGTSEAFAALGRMVLQAVCP